MTIQTEKDRLLTYARRFGQDGNWLVHGEDAIPALQALEQEGFIELDIENRRWKLHEDERNEPLAKPGMVKPADAPGTWKFNLMIGETILESLTCYGSANEAKQAMRELLFKINEK